jgi:hypothetical protein
MNPTHFCLKASRAEVESTESSLAVNSLCEMLAPRECVRLRRKLIFAIDGYDDDPRDLWEFPEVRQWICDVDRQWPYWFFFMDLGPQSTLAMVTFCACPWTKIPGGKKIDDAHLLPFVKRRLAAMDQLCCKIGDPIETRSQMSEDIFRFYGLCNNQQGR